MSDNPSPHARTQASAARTAGRAHRALDRSRRRLGWMDTLRGLSILLVILHHSTQIVAVPYQNAGDVPTVIEPFLYVSNFLAPFRMPMLMFLSGLLISGSLKRPAGQYVWGKLRRILWPIIVWTCVYNLALLAGGGELPGMPWEWAFWNTYLWFMQFVLVYYLVALLTKWIQPWVFVVIGLAGAFGLEWLGSIGAFAEDSLLQRLFYLMPFFFLGAFVERFWERFVAAINVPVAIALTAIPLALGLVSGMLPEGLWYEPLAAVPGLFGILALARVAVYIPDAGWLRPVRFVGRFSLIYYTVHYPAYAAIYNIIERLGIDSPGLVLPVVYVLTLAVATAFALVGRSLPFRLLFEVPRRIGRSRATAA